MTQEQFNHSESFESLKSLAGHWHDLAEDNQVLEISKIKFGGHALTTELMGAVELLGIPKEEKEEMKQIVALVSMTDLPMTEDELLKLLATDLIKAKRVLDIAYAFRKTIQEETRH